MTIVSKGVSKNKLTGVKSIYLKSRFQELGNSRQLRYYPSKRSSVGSHAPILSLLDPGTRITMDE
jgi:hypothetical protein